MSRGARSAQAPARSRRDPAGYVIVVVSYLLMAGTAPLVAWANAPAAIILALRMAFAAAALGVVFLRRPMIADWRRPGAAWRLVLMAAMSSVTLLLYFYAVLHTSVAIAIFFLFLMPVWVALFAPRIFHSPREPIVWPALGLALAGLGAAPRPRPARRGRQALARRRCWRRSSRASATPRTRSR